MFEAAKHFDIASSGGDVGSMYNLGVILAFPHIFGDNRIKQDEEKAKKLLRFAATHGYNKAALLYASMFTGKTSTESQEAFAILNKAADEGDPRFAGEIGMRYAAGYELPRDTSLGAKYLKRAVANEGTPAEMLHLAALYCEGEAKAGETDQESAERTLEIGLNLLQVSAEMGHLESYLYLTGLYDEGKGVEKDLKKARSFLRPAARAGNTEAMYQLGSRIVEEQFEDEETMQEGFDYVCGAASKGHIGAKLMLANYLYNGILVEPDKKRAVVLYKQIAEQTIKSGRPDPTAIKILATAYELGEEPVDLNVAEATRLWNISIEMGDTRSMILLGERYKNGMNGYEKDQVKAFELFRRAADLGDKEAMKLLADCYVVGEGVEKNETKAFEWLKKAVDLGLEAGLPNLGRHYYIGAGVPMDQNEAVKCWEKSVQAGSVIGALKLIDQVVGDVKKNVRKAEEDIIEKAIDLITQEMHRHPENPTLRTILARYLHQFGKDNEKKEAIKLLQGLSDTEAKFTLATILWAEGKKEDAVPLLRVLAGLGHVSSMFMLGKYFSMLGGDANLVEAAKFFKLASKEGDVRAHYALQYMYELGMGVEKNKEESNRLKELCAKANFPTLEELQKSQDATNKGKE